MQQLVLVGSISEQSLDVCLKGRARQKASEILSSLNGTLSVPQRQLLRMQLDHLKDLQDNKVEIEAEIQGVFLQLEEPIELLDSIPGIERTAAYTILAEIGHDMSAFPTAQHICSWAGLAWLPATIKALEKRKDNVLHQAIII
jgi:transposase